MKKSIENIEFLLKRFYTLNEVPIHVYNSKNEMIIKIGEKDHNQDPFLKDEVLAKKIYEQSTETLYPILEIEEGSFAYGAFLDKQKRCYIFGPIFLGGSSISKMNEYRKRHGIMDREYVMKKKDIVSLAKILSTVFFILCDEMIDEKKILLQNEKRLSEIMVADNEIEQYQFEKTEYGMEHLSYQYEQRYLEAVENGDISFFEGTLIEEPNALNKVGTLAKDSEKQLEYMCVSSTVLVCRAAIRVQLINVNREIKKS